MKKFLCVIFTLLIIVSVFSACSPKSDDVNSDTTIAVSETQPETQVSTTESESSSENESNNNTEADETSTTSTKTTVTTTKVNTTKTNTTAKSTTAAKKYSETTKKSTTAATTTTQKPAQCTNNNNHSVSCGNMGRWFSSKNEVDNYWSSICNDLGNKYENGQITWEEYAEKCPYGYETYPCNYCGKWTGNFRYR